MNIHKLTASIAAVLLSASLFSCSSDDFFGKPESGSTNGISFGVSTENSAATRANNANDGCLGADETSSPGPRPQPLQPDTRCSPLSEPALARRWAREPGL